jgi:hypothetical protein
MMRGFNRSLSAAISLLFLAAIAPAADPAGAPDAMPASRLKVELPATTVKSSASIAPEHLRSWIPLVSPKAGPRAARVVPVDKPATPEPLPAVYSMTPGVPEKPQFEQGTRLLVTPAAAMLPRIPNLLPTNRRAIRRSGNPIVLPASPITTPPVCNLDGTANLPTLPPMEREIVVEIAPQPAPLPFDQAPFLQSAVAPDDEDVPATLPIGAPGHVELK